jgi:hypothetical protein
MHQWKVTVTYQDGQQWTTYLDAGPELWDIMFKACRYWPLSLDGKSVKRADFERTDIDETG